MTGTARSGQGGSFHPKCLLTCIQKPLLLPPLRVPVADRVATLRKKGEPNKGKSNPEGTREGQLCVARGGGHWTREWYRCPALWAALMAGGESGNINTESQRIAKPRDDSKGVRADQEMSSSMGVAWDLEAELQIRGMAAALHYFSYSSCRLAFTLLLSFFWLACFASDVVVQPTCVSFGRRSRYRPPTT